MTRALIAEDEPLLAQGLRADLEALWPGLEICATAGNGPQALDLIEQLRPEVAFLDIRMPGMTGIEVAQALAEDWPDDATPPLIVFVTAHDEFAVEAFEQAAVDYVLKPVRRDRLAQAVTRLKSRLERPAVEASVDGLSAQLRALIERTAVTLPGAHRSERLRSIRAGVGDTVRIVPIGEVIYLQATDKYVNVVSTGGEALIREPLKELLPQLDPERFVQVHRGTVVNMDFVASATRDELGKLSLRLRSRDERIAVSRLYAHLFKAM
jgi:DNA-binding LytR/AlgR family response regulator